MEKISGIGQIRKLWDSQTPNERIETLRMEMRNNRYIVRRIAELESKLRKLEEHSHVDGKVVIPANFKDYGNDTASSYDALA